MRLVSFTLIVWLGLAATLLGQSAAPQIWLQPVNQTGEAGANVTFLVAASGSPAPTLQWQFSTDGNTWNNVSGLGYSGGTTNLLTIVGATTSQTGNHFRCVATNSVNSATSNAVDLVVLPTGYTVARTISGGGRYSLFLKSDGSLWGMGYNNVGQFGDGTTTDQSSPENVISSGIVAVSAGGSLLAINSHSLFVKSNGSLWAMGDNEYGQLGDGTTLGESTPEQVVSSGVDAVAAGDYFSLFLKSDGSVWAMGLNSTGQLGDGTTTNRSTPERVVSSGVVAISADEAFSLLLKSNGSVWAMGSNADGQLGDGTTTNRSTPEQVIPSGVIAISAGEAHSLFLKSDGSLWAVGRNNFGQLGDGTTTDQSTPEMVVSGGVVAISAAGDHSLFVKSDGSLWTMGRNSSGQLGNGGTATQITPQKIVSSGVMAISAGYNHSLFLKSDGSLWAMGDNTYGDLGDGTTVQSNIPLQIVSGFAIPAITNQSTAAEVVAGANPAFTITAGGTPSPAYQWQVSTDGGNTWNNVSGALYSGGTTATLTINHAGTTLLGNQYRAIITNSVGTTTSTPVPLVVGSSAAKLAWLQNNFTLGQLGNPGIIGDLATPANDGIPNLIKYAFNLPAFVNGQASLPQVTEGSGDLTLTFEPMQSDLTYTVEASTDLATWSTTGVNTAINAGVETATYAIPGQGAAFLRVVVAPGP